MRRKPLLPDTVVRIPAEALDARVSRTVPSAVLLVDSRRRMLCLRFRETKDLYDLTEFHLTEDDAEVLCTWADYTQLLFWVREEYHTAVLNADA